MILVSACLAGIECRYDGSAIPYEEVINLVKDGKAIPVCPEQLGGLPTPRAPCSLDKSAAETWAGKSSIYDESGVDKTENFIRGAEQTLRIVNLCNIRKAIFKAKSPSCGRDGMTTYLLNKEKIKISWLQ